MTLYIDIGNTSIKFNFKVNDIDMYTSLSSKNEYSIDSLYYSIPKEAFNNIKKVVICSVVPSLTKLMSGISKKYWQIEPLIIRYPIKTNIKIQIDEPKILGSDIVCLSAFVASKTKNGIIINFGTATTITHIKNNTVQGVVIMPGYGVSRHALLNSSVQLYETNTFVPKGKHVGKNSEESISIGTINGTKYAVTGLVNDIDPNADIFISGGFARELREVFSTYTFVKEATIEGMKIIERVNHEV